MVFWIPPSRALALVLALATTSLTLAPAHAADAPQAPAFSVKSLEGRPLRMADLHGKPVILDFWATWCGPCRASMPHLNAMQAKYGPKGLTVIGFSVDDGGPEPVRRFARTLGIRFPVAMAPDAVLDAYGPIRSIPTTIFVNRRGEIVRRVTGMLDQETMEGYVREIVD